MTSRTVFTIFGSFGPGGSFVVLMEKMCKRLFGEAYELGDPTEFKTDEEDKIKQVRQEYVNDLFNFKSSFERRSTSLNQLVQVKAYSDLNQIINKYKKAVLSLEKQRLAKERIFYLREENELKYKRALKKLDTIEEDVNDNLQKMAHHIVGASFEKIKEQVRDLDEGTIEERVTRHKADEYLDLWKKLKIEAEKNAGQTSARSTASESLLNQEIKLKDRLFVETGEDVDDIFIAFRHYGLNQEITEEDRQRLQA